MLKVRNVFYGWVIVGISALVFAVVRGVNDALRDRHRRGHGGYGVGILLIVPLAQTCIHHVSGGLVHVRYSASMVGNTVTPCNRL